MLSKVVRAIHEDVRNNVDQELNLSNDLQSLRGVGSGLRNGRMVHLEEASIHSPKHRNLRSSQSSMCRGALLLRTRMWRASLENTPFDEEGQQPGVRRAPVASVLRK
jgi:hypothetical protein